MQDSYFDLLDELQQLKGQQREVVAILAPTTKEFTSEVHSIVSPLGLLAITILRSIERLCPLF